MSEQEKACREAFELKFARPHHMMIRRLHDDRRYESMEVEFAYRAWQAALATVPEQTEYALKWNAALTECAEVLGMLAGSNLCDVPMKLREALATVAPVHQSGTDTLARACNLAGVPYEAFLRIKAYMPVTAPVQQSLTEAEIIDLARDECVDFRWPSSAIFIARAVESRLAPPSVEALNTQIDALNLKLDSLAPHGTCGCSYDAPNEVCLHHAPEVTRLTKEVERLTIAAKYAEHIDATPENQLQVTLYDACIERDQFRAEVERLKAACDELGVAHAKMASKWISSEKDLAKSNERLALAKAYHAAYVEETNATMAEVRANFDAAVLTAAQSKVPDGHVLVPIEPTDFQVLMGQLGVTKTCAIAIYKSMLFAAPEQPAIPAPSPEQENRNG